jgi:hypothetical protein
MRVKSLVIAAAVCSLGTTWSCAAGTAITSVTVSGSFVTSITVGSLVYPSAFLVPGTSSGGNVDGNVPDLNNITDVDNFNFLNGFSMSGSSGNFWTTSNFGGSAGLRGHEWQRVRFLRFRAERK